MAACIRGVLPDASRALGEAPWSNASRSWRGSPLRSVAKNSGSSFDDSAAAAVSTQQAAPRAVNKRNVNVFIAIVSTLFITRRIWASMSIRTLRFVQAEFAADDQFKTRHTHRTPSPLRSGGEGRGEEESASRVIAKNDFRIAGRIGLLRLAEPRSGARVCDPQPLRSAESGNNFWQPL